MNVQTLQRKPYCKAKAEPAYRFNLLYDKIHRDDILAHAYALARANAGTPPGGRDDVCGGRSDGAGGVARRDQEGPRAKCYRPAPVRRVMIPKPGGGERPLGIPQSGTA